MDQGRVTGLVVCAAIIAAVSAGAGEGPHQPLASHESDVVRIGAVASTPSVVTVFTQLRRHLTRHGFPSDYVLYSNYDALVAALARREIDIAWNTPLAHAKYHVASGFTSRTLVMRDVDCAVRSVLVARAESGIHSLKDLAGKRLVLGSSDAAEATVLPLHYLRKEQVKLHEITVVSLDKEVDFKGNPCSSPSHVLQALRDGRGDAGIITESLWRRTAADPSGNQKLKKIWDSPPFSHCVFTAPKDFEENRAKRFIELMTTMSPADPDCADIMRLEGTKKWLPGGAEGFDDLVEALRAK